MPDPIEDPKKPDKEAPKMAEGAPRDIAAINADMVKAVLAGQPIEELGKELVAAQAIAGASGGGAAPVVAPPEPPSMGMQPDQAYARAVNKKAVATLVGNLPGLDEKQKKYLLGRSSIDEVNEALEAMPRAVAPSSTLGMLVHPAKQAPTENESPMARAIREGESNPMLQRVMGLGALGRDGVHVEPGGGILVYIDGSARLKNQKARYDAKLQKRGAA